MITKNDLKKREQENERCRATTNKGTRCKNKSDDDSVYCYIHKDKLNLNDRQKNFCEEYIKDFNATRAYIDAGYQSERAEVAASRLLSNVKVTAYVEELKKQASERTNITIDNIIRELAVVGFSDLTDFLSVDTQEQLETQEEYDPEGNNQLTINQTQRIRLADLEELKARGLTPAISEIVETRNGIKIKTHSKIKALEKLLDHVAVDEEAVQRLEIEKEKLQLEKEKIKLQRQKLELLKEEKELGEHASTDEQGVLILPAADLGEE